MRIYWNVERHMQRKGWSTPYRLAKEAGISEPTAGRVLAGQPLKAIEVPTLLKLAAAFGVTRRRLLSLLRVEPGSSD